MNRKWHLGIILSLVALFVVARLVIALITERRDNEKIKKLFDVQSTLLAIADARVRDALKLSQDLDPTLSKRDTANEKLSNQVDQANKTIKVLKDRVKADISQSDSLKHLVAVVVIQDSVIENLRLLATGLGQQLAEIKEDRLKLRETMLGIRDDLANAVVNNNSLQKETSKRDPLLEADIGFGIATLPFNKFQTGPAITLTIRVLRFPLIR